ncbi:flagellar biosynthetic protein FliR [Oceanidesulfovibrio marinus]|uniref:Flagellar biosynthetic protein FliR n=1 Tax=Oceanidesulfovibrio marinus TaxID=370038 RepID=A0A6P1ZCQ8_9BACT|nr:flagellar biosynthetic protein FliR [Oceanidesulfovibrio marinus]QJT11325.1 flagellar biosynthetic protein FliR [Oceanidesulfovibrio marinus]TVM31055.1 flagellar biosynthetic protein FliR [Oceanidesulfovibrio marinus]
MEFLGIAPDTVLSFLLTLFRVSIVLFMLPFYGGDTIPRSVKAALTLVVTLAFWPHLSLPGSAFPTHPVSIILMILGEAAMGLTLGLIVHFIFAAIQTGGQIVGFQMGFAMVNVIDPITGTSEAVTAHFLWMVAMLTFLTLGGHLYLLFAVTKSFELVPPGSLFITPAVAGRVLEFSGQMFILAVRIAAPIMVSLFLVDLGLALVSRAAPQMNVLFVGFPIKVGVGFFFLGLVFTIISNYMGRFIDQFLAIFDSLMRLAA